jgi:hypothetical protein
MKKSNMGDDIGCWIQSVLYKKMQRGFPCPTKSCLQNLIWQDNKNELTSERNGNGGRGEEGSGEEGDI